MRLICCANTLKMKINSAYIEITNRCNLNCRDCYNSSGLNKSTTELDPDALMCFISELKTRFDVKLITISGGEPLLHSRINEILQAVSEFCNKAPDIAFNFITNGTTYNELFYDMLERDPHFYIQVSLDGPNEYANASMRGEGNFACTVNNVSKRRFINKPVYKMIINKKNAPYVEEYCNYVHSVLGGIPGYAFTAPFGNAVTNWNEMNLSVMERSGIVVKVRDLYKKLDIKDVSVPLPTSFCGLMPPDPTFTPCIKSNGSVQPCQNFYDERFSVGSIYDTDWDAVTSKINSLCEYLSARLSLDYGCAKCPLHNKCGRGCPAISVITCGDMLAPDGECEFRKISTLRMVSTRNTMCWDV